jgi:hypothetical protein
MKYIWVGVIPDIFGYGITVASLSRSGAFRALRKAYNQWKVHRPNSYTCFATSYEDWGGRVEKIELDKAYNDNFAE